jgi:primosomal protein N' (replication factor Y)
MRFDSAGAARDNPGVSLPLACDASAHAPAYAEVALLPALPGKDLLTYRVEETERARIRPGVRVVVPLGGRRETGLVVALTSAAPPGLASIRAVAEVLDTEPIFTPELVALCRWASDYYVTTLAEVLAAALPGGLRASSARLVRLADAGEAAVPRPAATVARSAANAPRRRLEAAILDHLRATGPATTRQLARAIGHAAVARAVRTLAARGAVIVEEQLRAPAAKARLLTVFILARELAPEEVATLGRRAPRQRAVYDRLLAAAEHRLDASALTLTERTAADALARRGVAARLRAERYRDARPPLGPERPPPALTAEQQAAVDAVTDTAGFQVFLLHGVTGSGKTEVYLQLAARARAAGRSVLMLVPEIALTHQLVLRVQERFGSGVALLHSGLGPGERWDEWRRIARGEAGVVVGARSAVFAPLTDLGLVIVDEEHDTAYKQDEGLRYNARDLALVRAKLAGAGAILGSATPSIESYQQALDGKFRLLSLTHRVEGRPLPEVELVDLRRPAPGLPRPAPLSPQPASVSRSWQPAPLSSRPAPVSPSSQPASTLFSPRLLEAMGATLERREQVLLFLNRRGFATSLQCLACGEPAGCPSCSVSLTLHERRGVLLCHHCGYARPSHSPCTTCRNGELRACGEGTERIEAEVARLFPTARIGRLDRDTTARRGAHRRILDAWSTGTLDVMIGTQMVAKGHDVPGVTLVGVLLADVALNMPDFRAAERAFQLLTQVAGRAGRGDAPGRVLVQTYRPEHHSLRAAAAHDYQGFAPRELALRRELGYPPFTRLAVLRLEGADLAATERAATELASRGRATAAGGAVTVRGPAAAPLERLRGRYRWQILLSSASARALRDLLRRLLTAWRAGPAARTTRLVVDMDPVSML